MFSLLRRLLIGKPLPTRESSRQTIGKFVGLAVFASDVLSSVAYATEEILIVLAVAGPVFFGLSLPIAGAICTLLFIVTISYRQTIFAYPNGGGAYIVARENLGEHAAQVAGAALLTDYILTVAVSVASGVAHIASAFPGLVPWRVVLAVAAIAVMMVINLRGVKDAGRIFAIPTYFFLVMILGMLSTGFFQFFRGTLPNTGGMGVPQEVFNPLTLFLLLRAFSSGAVALTGVEAISNGIPVFREPRSKNAANTMVWMSVILGSIFLGVTFLAWQIHVVPAEHETVISQLARTIYGPGMLHILTLSATTVILIMAANTAFAGFPRLAALHAADGFLPRHLTCQGSRLVFSWGIVLLAGAAAFLVVLFRANVTHLIPLYAIGVFLSFTLSQMGMVVHWSRMRSRGGGESVLFRQALNGVGALMTFLVMLILAVTKFTMGAWIVLFLIPTMVWVFSCIHYHYRCVAAQLSLEKPIPPFPQEKTVVILVGDMHQGTLRAVELVRLLHPAHVRAVHIAIIPEEAERLREKWQHWAAEIPLDIVESPYRELVSPLMSYIEQLDRQWSDDTIVVAMPTLIPTRLWHYWLHSRAERYIRDSLEQKDNIVIVDVPYRLGASPSLTRA